MRLFKSYLVITFLLSFGKISGFLRDFLIAFYQGADRSSDIALLLISLPDLFTNFILAGGFSSTLVPIFSSLSQTVSVSYFRSLSTQIFFLFSIFTAFIVIYSHLAIKLFLPSFSNSDISSFLPYFRITLIGVPITALTAVSQAYLLSEQNFKLSQSGTLFFNLSIIFFLLIPFDLPYFSKIVIAILLGVVLRYSVQFFAVKPFTYSSTLDKLTPSLIQLIRKLFPATLFSLSIIISPLIARSFASTVDDGAFSLFTYAFKLSDLPITLISGSFSTLLIGSLAESLSEDSEPNISLAAPVIRYSFMFSISMLIPLFIFTPELIGFLFDRSSLSAEQLFSLISLSRVSFLSIPSKGLLLFILPLCTFLSKIRFLYLGFFLYLLITFVFSFVFTDALGLVGSSASILLSSSIVTLVFFSYLSNSLRISFSRLVFCNPISSLLIPSLSSCFVGLIWQRFYNSPFLFIPASISCILVFWFSASLSDPIVRQFFFKKFSRLF